MGTGASSEKAPKIYRERVDPFSFFTDAEFRRRYRFTKTECLEIVEIVRDELKDTISDRGKPIPVELKVLSCLSGFARKKVQEDTADLHGFSQPTMSRISAEVSRALAKKANDFIKFPASAEEEAEEMKHFYKIAKMPQIIGAIDCTHVRIKKTGGEHAQMFINRKGYYSLNVQVVCNAQCKITNIVARWRGSVHDSRIFNESSIKARFEAGDYTGRLLGDSGYACTPYMLTPVLNPKTPAEHNYNKAQASTRNIIERTFGQWKQRFRSLLEGLNTNIDNVKVSIVAMAVLHNLDVDMKAKNEWHDDDSEDAASSEEDEDVAVAGHGQATGMGNHVRAQYIRQNFS